MTAVNVLFAALLAAGVFAAVMGLGVRRPVSLSTLEELAGGGAAARGPLKQGQAAGQAICAIRPADGRP